MSQLTYETCFNEFLGVFKGVPPTADCFKFAISKGLSAGIIAGAVLVKVPQVHTR